MNNKITFPKLASLLADRSGRSKRFSEDFLRELFSLVSECLEKGESVKVKGLGTFRLTRVEPRKSVDVNTGEPMEISGHSKVIFVPAKDLAEAVNSPFEAFSAVEIKEGVDVSKLFEKEDSEFEKDDLEYDTADDLSKTEFISEGVDSDSDLFLATGDDEDTAFTDYRIINFHSSQKYELSSETSKARYHDEDTEMDDAEAAVDIPSATSARYAFPDFDIKESAQDAVSDPADKKDYDHPESTEKEVEHLDPVEEPNDLENSEKTQDEKAASPHIENAKSPSDEFPERRSTVELDDQEDDQGNDLPPSGMNPESVEFSTNLSGMPQSRLTATSPEESTNETTEEETHTEETEEETKSRSYIYIWACIAAAICGFLAFAGWKYYTGGMEAIPFISGIIASAEKQKQPDSPIESNAILTDTTTSVKSSEAAESFSTDSIQDPEVDVIVPTAPSDALVYDTIGKTRYLTTMAQAHYGNFNLWPYIYQENKEKLGHPDRIRPGTPVVIPKLDKYGIDPKKDSDIEAAKKLGKEIYAKYGKNI